MRVKPEIAVFLKYTRKRECWVCSLCDTENEDNKCRLCGSVRLSDSVVRPTWDNMIHTPVTTHSVAPTEQLSQPQYIQESEGDGNGKTVGIVIAWVVIVFILILIIVSNY